MCTEGAERPGRAPPPPTSLRSAWTSAGPAGGAARCSPTPRPRAPQNQQSVSVWGARGRSCRGPPGSPVPGAGGPFGRPECERRDSQLSLTVCLPPAPLPGSRGCFLSSPRPLTDGGPHQETPDGNARRRMHVSHALTPGPRLSVAHPKGARGPPQPTLGRPPTRACSPIKCPASHGLYHAYLSG